MVRRVTIPLPVEAPPSESGASLTLSSDGSRLVYSANMGGMTQLYTRQMDHSEFTPIPGTEGADAPSPEPLWESEFDKYAGSWSPDGRTLAFTENPPPTTVKGDIWLLTIDGERKAKPYLQTPYTETAPKVSPDGRWLAFVSDESGRNEIYVAPVSGPVGRKQISIGGGSEPRWARSGREIFYRNGGKMMAVRVQAGDTLSMGVPRLCSMISMQPRASLVSGAMTSPTMAGDSS